MYAGGDVDPDDNECTSAEAVGEGMRNDQNEVYGNGGRCTCATSGETCSGHGTVYYGCPEGVSGCATTGAYRQCVCDAGYGPQTNPESAGSDSTFLATDCSTASGTDPEVAAALRADTDGDGCPAGTAGPSCQYSDEATCSGNGDALFDGSCYCKSGFGGADCAKTGASECSGNGEYDGATGTCTCFADWTGDTCFLCSAGREALAASTEDEVFNLFYGVMGGILAAQAVGYTAYLLKSRPKAERQAAEWKLLLFATGVLFDFMSTVAFVTISLPGDLFACKLRAAGVDPAVFLAVGYAIAAVAGVLLVYDYYRYVTIARQARDGTTIDLTEWQTGKVVLVRALLNDIPQMAFAAVFITYVPPDSVAIVSLVLSGLAVVIAAALVYKPTLLSDAGQAVSKRLSMASFRRSSGGKGADDKGTKTFNAAFDAP